MANLVNKNSIIIPKEMIRKKDAPILASAFSNSNHLLTLDNDFLNEKIRNFARKNNILILTPKEFIEK